MPDSPIASTKGPQLVPAAALDSFNALKSHRSSMAMALAYSNALRRMIFPRLTSPDRKLVSSHRRVLDSYDTLPILQLIWRESPFVPDEHLASVGLSKSFKSSTLTSHALAVAISPTAAEVGMTIKRVSGIVRACVAAGLIDEERVGPKKNIICGSAFLHEFMVAVAGEQSEVLGIRTTAVG